MHRPKIRAEALALVERGLNDCEISRRLGVPRRTILDWRRPSYVPRPTTPMETCPRCWRAAKPMRFAPADYSALLGTYLGDGSISSGPRTMRLRIALDAKYPRIIEETRALLDRCFPANSVDVIRKNLKGEVPQRVDLLPTICHAPARSGPKAQTKDRSRALASRDHRCATVGVHPSLQPMSTDRSLRVPELPLREHVEGHHRSVRAGLRARGGLHSSHRGPSRALERPDQSSR